MWVGSGGVLLGGRGRAGNQAVEALEVTAGGGGGGQLGDLLRRDVVVGFGAVSLKQRGRRADRNLLVDRADLKQHVHAGYRVGEHVDAVLLLRGKALSHDGDLVSAGIDVVERIAAVGVAFRLAGDAGGGVERLNAGIGDDRAGRVRHIAGQRTVQHLGIGGERAAEGQARSQQDVARMPEGSHQACVEAKLGDQRGRAETISEG